MSVECLPEAIKTRLASFLDENNYSTSPSTITLVTSSQIGSSCIITISQVHRQPIRFFIKFLSPNTNNFTSEAILYFQNETIFYQEIANFSELQCIPKSYCVSSEDYLIILEDLQEYKSLKVGECLSVELIARILEHLGHFHAHSFANRCREATSKLQETLFLEKHRKVIVAAIHDALRLLKKSLPETSLYIEKFSGFVLGVFETISHLALDDEDYKVVTHGDLWPNNILWRERDNSIKFVDFQACRFSSPIHDLMLILLTGLDKKTRIYNFDKLVKHYHLALCTKLNQLGLDPLRIFPFSTLEEQLKKHSRVSLAIAIVGLPLFYTDGSLSKSVVSNNVNDFFEHLRTQMSLKCKSKMLDIIMDCIDLGFI